MHHKCHGARNKQQNQTQVIEDLRAGLLQKEEDNGSDIYQSEKRNPREPGNLNRTLRRMEECYGKARQSEKNSGYQPQTCDNYRGGGHAFDGSS